MSVTFFSRSLPTLLILTLASPPASGKPLPPGGPAPPPSKITARSSHNGGLQTWEIIVIVLGSVLAIMLIGGLGGACEVLLHTRGKIVQSNAEADAKVEGGSRAVEVDDGTEDENGDAGSNASTEVEDIDIDLSHFSWQQQEKMTTGGGVPEDRALSEADTSDSSQTTLHGEQSSVNGAEEPMHDVDMDWNMTPAESSEPAYFQGQTGDRALQWDDETHPDPALARFVIGDDEDQGYKGQEDTGYDNHQDHYPEPVTMPDETDFQHANSDGYGHHEDTWDHEADSNQGEERTEPVHERIGEALAVAAVGQYSGEGYSPAAMPDEGDYLEDYRQSQLYLQQEDDWQQYYNSSHGASEMDYEQEGHHTQGSAVPQPDAGYF